MSAPGSDSLGGGAAGRHCDSLAWGRLYVRAWERLRRHLTRWGELSPPQAARVVASVLPLSDGHRLLRRLAELGWLERDAHLPFDILDSPACPADLRQAPREFLSLALFGLPGQGRPDFKHRESTYQTLCAQILREANDAHRLAMVATRALSHPDVCRDPVLAAMVRGFVAEQESALRAVQRVEQGAEEPDSQLRNPFLATTHAEMPTRPQLLRAFASLRHEFEAHLAEYNEAAARYALEKMQDLTGQYPDHIDAAAVGRYAEQFADLQARCARFREQVEIVARRAAQAAQEGNTEEATWLMRRLRAIHALTPALLPTDRFEALRHQVKTCGKKAEHREALHDLIRRERDVADQIKRAGAAIYRFHQVAQTAAPGTDEYERAAAAYEAAVAEVRALDTEWLTGLLLELETYLEDLDDPEGRAVAQLDRFIGTVRNALTQLRRVIRALQQERGALNPDELEGGV